MTAFTSYWDDDLDFDPEASTQPEFNQLHRTLSDPYAVTPYMQRNTEAERDADLTWSEHFDAAWTGALHGFTTYGPEQLYRAARTLARMAGNVMDTSGIEQWAAEGIEENILERERDPWYRPDPRWMESSWGRSLYGGFSNFTSSMMTYLPAAASAMALAPASAGAGMGALLFGGASYLAGSGTSAAVAGLAEYDSFMDEALRVARDADPSVTYDMLSGEKFWGAVYSAMSEVGTEFAGDLVAGKAARLLPAGRSLLSNNLTNAIGRLAAAPVAGLVGKTMTNMVNNIATEIGSEAANAALQDYIREISNMPHQGRAKAIQDMLGPALVSGALGGIKNTVGGTGQQTTVKELEAGLRASDRERRITMLSPEAIGVMDSLSVDSRDNGKSAYQTALVLDALAKRTSEETGTTPASVLQGIDSRDLSLQSLVQTIVNPDAPLTDVANNAYGFLESRLTEEARSNMRAAFANDEGVVDAQSLSDAFQTFVRNGKIDEITAEAQPAFKAMRDMLTDSVLSLDNLSGMRVSREAASTFRQPDYRRPKDSVIHVDQAGMESVYSRWADKDLSDQTNLTTFMSEALSFVEANFTSTDGATDVQGIFNDMAKAYQPLIDRISRGTGGKPNTKTLSNAKAVLEDVNGWELFSDTFKNVENVDEKQAAIGMVLMTATAHSKALAKYIVAADAFDTPLEMQHVALSQNIAMLYQADKGIGREIARALNIRKLHKGDPQFNEKNQAYLRSRGDVEARRLQLIALVNSDNPQKDVQAPFLQRTVDAVMEYAMSTMLTGPSSHLVNITGNVIQGGLRTFERAIGQYAIPRVREGVASGEVAGMIMGFWESFLGIGNIWRTHRDNYSAGLGGTASAVVGAEAMWKNADSKAADAGYMHRAISAERFHLSSEHGMLSGNLATAVDMLGSVTHIPFALLNHEDQIAKHVFAGGELRALLVREAGGDSTRLRELMENPPRDLVEAAQESAKNAVFQGKLGKFSKSLDDMRNSFPLLRYFIPFLKTPINIFKEGVSMTPILSRLIGDTKKRLSSNDVATRQLAEAHVMLGTLIWSTALMLAEAGYLTGPGPEDPEKASRKRATGWMPNALKLGDTYAQIDRFDPLALIFNGAAFMVEAMDSLDRDDAERGWLMGIGQGMRAVMSRTYMTSLYDFMNFLMMPERGVPSFERRLGSTVVPFASFGRSLNRSIDGFQRESESFWDGVYQSIPGLSPALPVRRDFLGQPVKSPESYGPDWLSPFRIGTKKNDAVYQEVARLQEAGFNAAAMPSRTVQNQGREVRMTPVEYGNLLDNYGNKPIDGKSAYTALQEIVRSSEYQAAPDEAKAKTLRQTLGRYAREAKRQMLSENPRMRKQFGVKSQGWEYLLGNTLR